jgi:pimeloyl-ACP methyl ester carboxylesterase
MALRKSEVVALGALAGDALATAGGFVGQFHGGIAARPFKALGPAAAPARAIHDGISSLVYDSVRVALKAAATGVTAILALTADDSGASLDATRAGSIALSALNGLYGDRLDRRADPLALGMSVRRDGRDVRLTREAIAAAFPDATQRLAVFVHGLCETDESWTHPLAGGERSQRRSYGDHLHDELGYTPLYVRYNSGLHVSDNGRELATLLAGLVENWPRTVTEIVLVGHSMGGLVARSACHQAWEGGHASVQAIRHVVCLGTPHLGADLEKGLNVAGWALARLPETRALGALVNARSAGIKDLRFGSCAEADWRDRDPDEFLRDRCQEVPFVPHARYHFVATRIAEGPLGSILGDLLVRVPSATGRGRDRGRRIPFERDDGRELTGLSHFDLLNHPRVGEALSAWLEP